MEQLSNLPSTLAQLALLASEEVRSRGPNSCHALISCSKSKGGHRELARNMYVSPLYRKSVVLSERWGLDFSILSAKYGLLDPNEIIEPYDLTLKGATRQFKTDWAEKVDGQIRRVINKEKRLIVLAGDDYFGPLTEAGRSNPLNFLAPMRGLSLGNRLAFLNEAIRMEKRRVAIARAYELFEDMAKRLGLRRLREVLEADLPKQGVYFFFDENELTAFSASIPRLVRIGTHGVSLGSLATLRNRLRTHFGTRAGVGNHRGSVFRLHVGRAIIEREGLRDIFPSWGKGQSAPREIVLVEAPMEARVSQYIGNLHVLFIPILDLAGTSSMRATIERQFITMFTERHCAIEKSSSSWLGQSSDKPEIRTTGLWNVRDVGGEYDPKFIPLLESILSRKSADALS